MEARQRFGGDSKVGESVLSGLENSLRSWGTPRIPSWLETYHLTMLTLLWSVLNLFFGWLARENIHWLWMVSLMIVCQYLSDVFDGAVGRYRNTGLIKWGFYMDHFMDFIFLGSLVLTGYIIAPDGTGFYYLALLLITGAFMVSSYLNFSATNEFKIYYLGLGPTELRIAVIIINTVIIFTGTGHFKYTVPLLCLVCLFFLVLLVWNTSRELWRIDMENKKAGRGDS